MDEERRREDRRSITLVVDYDGPEDLLADFTTNLSRGGTFIQTDRNLTVGQRIELSLSFPGLLRRIAIAGHVRWIGASETSSGVGIQFDNYDGEISRELERILAAIARRDKDYVSEIVDVLLCEDNPHVRRLISQGLKKADMIVSGPSYSVTEVVNGQDALNALAERSFDLLVIDVYLPVLDGVSTIRRIRSDRKIAETPIVAVSAGGPAVKESALAAGANFFIDKPMRLRDIIDTVRLLRAGSPARP